MAFTDLTSTASVRSALGVSERELRDTVLQDPIYSVMLTEALYAIHVDLFDDFIVVAAIDPAVRTSIEKRFFDLVQTYSAYHVAIQCLGAVPMFAPKVIKDDRTEVQRSEDPYRHLRTDLPAALALLLTSLRSVYQLVNPDATYLNLVTRIMAVASPLATDPVTG